ncbi:transcriptional regulator, GntR family [Hyphomonas neptunium ATCC 15444]|uniref:Transcriptional regulator, GntR family n=2 Tax=Hyphomonas TaxID=85 RepID=Q0C041_HYPNA|nr:MULTISPECIES: GntR family transcriptional regulator [Hyphomonas]ABI75503.1 transcriptional regulator, GntR family [Hyphomonas neptunium ATCC 15444]KCZ90515.1 GntR family transcriptional regulator [Hyphomonas hirschiana VP5]
MSTVVEKVTLHLRDMIMSGQFEPGERISEVGVARTLDVSRTPVRWALSILETEGLVSGTPNKGFRLRTFTPEEVLSAYEVRGALEGLACRLAAQRGLSAEAAAEFDACLAEGEALISNTKLDEHTVKRWSAMNGRFHTALLDAAHCPAIEPAYEAVSRYPAAAPGAIMFLTRNLRAGFSAMKRAHEQHVAVVDALKAGQPMRAEYLIREHIDSSGANVRVALQREQAEASAQGSAGPATRRTRRSRAKAAARSKN